MKTSSSEPQNKRLSFAALILTGLIILVVIVLIIQSRLRHKGSEIVNQVATSSEVAAHDQSEAVEIIPELKSILSQADSNLVFNELPYQEPTFNWTEGENTFSLPANYGVQLISYTVPTSTPYKLSEKLNNLIDSIFIKNGFTPSLENAWYNENYAAFKGYKKGDLVCSVRTEDTWYTPTDPRYSNRDDVTSYILEVSCSDKLKEKAIEQLPFIAAMNLKNTETSVSVVREKDDFYYVSTFANPSGISAYLKKTSTGYDVLLKTQDAPTCNFVKKYGIPKEVANECYDQDSGDIRTL
jgi:hypothetical protein